MTPTSATLGPCLSIVPIAADPLDGIDIDDAIAAAADDRPWHARRGWHEEAACRGRRFGAPTDGDSSCVPDPCTTCPVRTRCAVDGLRMNIDGFLAESVDQIADGYGGLTTVDAGRLLDLIRTEAARRGIGLYERAAHLASQIIGHHRSGLDPVQIADLVDIPTEVVWDALIPHLARAGRSNREIAPALGASDRYPDGVSYKWVERRRKALGCAPGDLASTASAAAA